MEERARLVRVDQDRAITKETDPEFWFQYQRAILLALKDESILNEAQYRHGVEKLKNQFRTSIKQKSSRGNAGERWEAR